MLQGALYLYEKNNGYGEYIFDWGWAQAYERNGLNYYPKLVSAVPLHLQQEENCSSILKQMPIRLERNFWKKLWNICAEETAPHSISFTLLLKNCRSSIQWDSSSVTVSSSIGRTIIIRISISSFLNLKRKRRKEIIRERKQIKEQMITVSVLEGDDIKRAHSSDV